MEAAILAATILALACVERTPALRRRALPLLRAHFGTDLFYLATGVIGLGLALRSLAAAYAGELSFPTGALGFALTLVLYDLGQWTAHALLHRYEPLWRLHKVHHSSRALDWLATFRAHPLEHALRHALSPVLLLLAGVPVPLVGVAGAVHGAWATFVHANLRELPRWVEGLLVTPRLHRLHHVATTGARNLGTFFTWWDWAAGRLTTAGADDDIGLGVIGEIESYPQRVPAQFVEPFRSGGARGVAIAAS